MKIKEQLEILKNTIQQANEVIKNSEQSIDILMDSMLKNATNKDLKIVQEQKKQIHLLLNKAKKGKNVDKEIKTMTKIIKNGS